MRDIYLALQYIDPKKSALLRNDEKTAMAHQINSALQGYVGLDFRDYSPWFSGTTYRAVAYLCALSWDRIAFIGQGFD